MKYKKTLVAISSLLLAGAAFSTAASAAPPSAFDNSGKVFSAQNQTQSVANLGTSLGRSYVHFYWAFKNNSSYTLTNVYMAHTADGVVNGHSFASIAPGQVVGNFWGDGYTGVNDLWVLSFWVNGVPFYTHSYYGNNQPKQCNVWNQDLNSIILMQTLPGAHPAKSIGTSYTYFTTQLRYAFSDGSWYDDPLPGFSISMPSGTCSDYLENHSANLNSQ